VTAKACVMLLVLAVVVASFGFDLHAILLAQRHPEAGISSWPGVLKKVCDLRRCEHQRRERRRFRIVSLVPRS